MFKIGSILRHNSAGSGPQRNYKKDSLTPRLFGGSHSVLKRAPQQSSHNNGNSMSRFAVGKGIVKNTIGYNSSNAGLLDALKPQAKEDFLKKHDPRKALSLEPETILYGVVDSKAVETSHLGFRSAISAAPKSLEAAYDYIDCHPDTGTGKEFYPSLKHANTLDMPVLSLMQSVGRDYAARNYNHCIGIKEDQKFVEIRLRDITSVGGGGHIYANGSSNVFRYGASSDPLWRGTSTHPLLIPVPEGAKIPVKVIKRSKLGLGN